MNNKELYLTKVVILTVLSVTIVSVLAGIGVNHRQKLGREAELYRPPGGVYSINGHDMHLFSGGEGDKTLVFLAGAQNSSPTMDFKPLWNVLGQRYKFAVIERRGYGWSDPADVSRDVQTVMEESRSLLQAAGVKGPYVLVPQSMAGIEALYWAQQYPAEVEAIIGLDAGVPEIYKQLDIGGQSRIMRAFFSLSRNGGIRIWDGQFRASKIMNSPYLSEEDKATYMAMVYRSFGSPSMADEIIVAKSNALLVEAGDVPSTIPLHYFISDGRDLPFPDWRNTLSSYTDNFERGSYTFLDCGHEVNNSKTEEIIEKIDEFLLNIPQ